MSTVWRDGHLVEVVDSTVDPDAGWGVFTTVGCDGGRPLLWAWHRERLAASLARLGAADGVRLPDEEELCRLLTVERLGGCARIRVVGRAATNSRWRVVATAAALDGVGPACVPDRLVIRRWPAIPSLAGHKMLNREKWDLARAEARAQGADDALIVDAANTVLETSVANVWIRSGDRVLTPPAPDRCLPGVMRRWILESVGDLGVEAAECDITVDDVAAADEVFLSNAIVGLRPVSRIVDRRWSAWPLFESFKGLQVPAPGWS
jgi:branched-subunit amino acid aminotransferase/4-amino-4-deoxychorismate lyase